MKFLDYTIENKKLAQNFDMVIGCDEVGRGPLAGPVVACSVVLDPDHIKKVKFADSFYEEINDSKKLSSVKRFQLEKMIRKHALGFGFGVVSAVQIDKFNIHVATLLAMKRAVQGLENNLKKSSARILDKKISHETKRKHLADLLDKKVCILIDGKFEILNLEIRGVANPAIFKNIVQQAVVGGDSKVLSIAAASVLAKTYRDRIMLGLATKLPRYGFHEHKGYGTFKHREAIKKYGLVPGVHRQSFVHFI